MRGAYVKRNTRKTVGKLRVVYASPNHATPNGPTRVIASCSEVKNTLQIMVNPGRGLLEDGRLWGPRPVVDSKRLVCTSSGVYWKMYLSLQRIARPRALKLLV